MATRKYPRSGRRVINDWATFVADSEEYIWVCLNRAVTQVARKLILQQGHWPTSYAKTYLPDEYEILDNSDVDFLEEKLAEWLESTNDMNCSDLTTVLSDISDAISLIGQSSGGACACGSGGAGGTTEPPSSIEPGPPGARQGDPPDGFSTWDEYETYKCDVAEYIWESVRKDATWWETVNITTMTAGAFGVALITPVPGDEIVLLIALLTAMSLQGVYATAIQEMLNALTNNKSDFICAMYEASNASAAKTAIDGAVETAVDAETIAFHAPLQKDTLKKMFNQTALNDLFEKNDGLAGSGVLPVGDCDSCEECPFTLLTYGTDQGGGVYASEDRGASGHDLQIWFNEPVSGYDPANFCGNMVRMMSQSVQSGSITQGPQSYTWRLREDDGVGGSNTIYEDTTPPSVPTGYARYLRIISDTAFTIQMTWEEQS